MAVTHCHCYTRRLTDNSERQVIAILFTVVDPPLRWSSPRLHRYSRTARVRTSHGFITFVDLKISAGYNNTYPRVSNVLRFAIFFLDHIVNRLPTFSFVPFPIPSPQIYLGLLAFLLPLGCQYNVRRESIIGHSLDEPIQIWLFISAHMKWEICPKLLLGKHSTLELRNMKSIYLIRVSNHSNPVNKKYLLENYVWHGKLVRVL